MYNNKIQLYKWEKKKKNTFFKSCKDLLDLKECQIYQPYFSLYFHLHNTKGSHKLMDIKRRFFVNEVIEINKEKYHTSNVQVKCNVFDTKYQRIYQENLFCKCVPLLDPLNYMMNNYNNLIHRNPLLPSCYSYNTFSKINTMDNSAYIDTFFSLITSEITLNNTLPSFPIYYGSVNGIKKTFNYDITDDYTNLRSEEWFYKNLGKTYSIDMYVSSDEEDDHDKSDDDKSDDDKSDDDKSDIYYQNDDYISLLKDIPCQLFFIEKLEGTIEDLLTNDINELNIDLLLSCLFQVSFALSYLQKKYQFTHNDLHINNVMYCKTEKDFLYYKFNNIYFKVPTYGYIFKIIDFGRSIFTYHNKMFFNDTFDKHNEAEGQYTLPFNKLLFKSKRKEGKIEPNYNFDLCRLSITIIDACDINIDKDYKDKQYFIDFLSNLTLNKDNVSLSKLDDNFDMYISIAKESNNALPKDIIQNFIFNNYRIKKKNFPKKLYYSFN